MAIVRLGHLSAETRVVTDIAYFANLPAISAAQAKTGTYSYDLGLATGPFGFGLSDGIAAGRLGYWHYMANTSINNACVIYQAGNGLAYPANANTNMIAVRIDSGAGQIYITRPDADNSYETLASAVIPTQYGSTGTWFHVGITHKVDAATGFLTVYINGNVALTYTGDTRPSNWDSGMGAMAYINEPIYWLGPGAASTSGTQGFSDAFVDDMYLDSIIGEVDAPVPGRRFMMVLPTGVGADAGWTPQGSANNWENVDDNPNDGDASYNKALAANLRDTFAYGDIVLPADHSIVAVIVSPFAKKLDTDLAHQLSVHAYDGLTYADSADLDLSMSYAKPVFGRFTAQPDASAWNEVDFNAMQFGYRSRGTF